MRLSRRATEALLWAAGAAGVVVVALVQATLAYEVSPLVALGLPIALGVALLVLLRPQAGILLGLAAVPLEVARTATGSFSLSPMELMLLLTAGSIAVRWAVGAERIRVDPVFLVYGTALVWILVGLAGARDSFVVVRITLMWTAFGLVGLYVANQTPAAVRRTLQAVVFAAAANAAIAILTGSALQARDGATAVDGRAQGAFTHPNQLAFFLVMALPCGLVLAMQAGRRGPRLLAAAASALMLAALLLTLTRGAIIGAAASLMVMLVWAPFRRLAGVVLIGLLLFAVVNGDALSRSRELSLVSARLSTVLDRESATVNNGRLRIWATVPRIVADHPIFGVSVGNFSEYSLAYGLVEQGQPFLHAHNVALTVVAEQGLPGLALLIVVLVLLGRSAAGLLRSRGDPLFPLGLGVMAGLAALSVNAMTDYPPGSNPNMALVLMLFGALTALHHATRPRHP